MKGADIVSRARLVLNDPSSIRWADAELALWITDGQRAISIRRPDSCSVNQAATLVAGSKQSIATLTPPGMRLLDVVRATAIGRAVRLVDRDTLDSHRPGWHAATQGVPTNYVYDNRDPKTFYVYPPATVGTVLEIIYSRDPVVITEGNLNSQDLSIDDVFSESLLNYVLFRAYGKDSDDTMNATLAAAYLSAFSGAMGEKVAADVAFSPDMNTSGGRPNPGATAGGV